jgi:GntR family transcriptional repressor for pyruvate dehydrogenase complex
METIEKIAATGKAVSMLKELVTSGELSEGEKLPDEKELAKRIGVGVAIVRETLFILQVLGYVEIIRGQGTFKAKMEKDVSQSVTDWFAGHFVQMSDYMEARRAIETTAVTLAVKRARDSEIEQLEQIHKIFERAVKDNDIIALVEADKAFHQTIIKAAHNRVFKLLNYTLEKGFEKYRIEAFSMRKTHINSLIPHRNIINAIKMRDADAAMKAMMSHLDIAQSDLSDSQKTG